LFQRETLGAKCIFAVLYDEHLGQHCSDPYAVEYRVGEKSLEHVALAVNLASVDLIKQRHHNECIEDYCEVLGGLGTKLSATARRYVQHFVTNE